MVQPACVVAQVADVGSCDVSASLVIALSVFVPVHTLTSVVALIPYHIAYFVWFLRHE